MAKPIKETPVLTGDDATRFEQAAQEVVPASQKEINEAKQAYSFFASIATCMKTGSVHTIKIFLTSRPAMTVSGTESGSGK